METVLEENVANKVWDIEASRIHADDTFNCRGFIQPSSVLDLAKSIKENGLQQPITVQPYDVVQRQKTGKDYRIIQGHRRFTALTQVNGVKIIPCMIREGLNELDALKMNFIENIQRLNLNIMDEAYALKKMEDAGMTQLEMARELRKERPWIQTRLYCLEFPEDIQDEIRKGTLKQAHIHEIHNLPPDQWYAAVKHIKEQLIKADGKRVKIRTTKFKPPKPGNLVKAKARNTGEVLALLDWLMDNVEPSIHTRTLAWAAGECSTVDLLKDYQTFYKENGYDEMKIPVAGIPGL